MQLKEGIGVRQTFNGVETDVHAGVKKADGTFPSQTVVSANCPVIRTAAGIARSGVWASSFWVSPDRAGFEKAAQDLFDKKGRRLIHVSTYPEGKARRWVGIARSGDWASSFWVSPDRASFEKAAQDLFDKKGRRLIHVSTYPEGKARRWVGIARSGDWASSFWVSPTIESLQWKSQKLFDEAGRRLLCVAFDSD